MPIIIAIAWMASIMENHVMDSIKPYFVGYRYIHTYTYIDIYIYLVKIQFLGNYGVYEYEAKSTNLFDFIYIVCYVFIF